MVLLLEKKLSNVNLTFLSKILKVKSYNTDLITTLNTDNNNYPRLFPKYQLWNSSAKSYKKSLVPPSDEKKFPFEGYLALFGKSKAFLLDKHEEPNGKSN